MLKSGTVLGSVNGKTTQRNSNLQSGSVLGKATYKPTIATETKKKKPVKKDFLSTLGYVGKEFVKAGGEFREGSAKLAGAGLEQVGRLTSMAVDNPVGKFVFGKEAADYENNPFYQIGNAVTSKNTTRELLKPLDKKFDNKSYIEPNSIVGQLPGAVGQVAAMIKNPVSGLKGVALSTAGSGYSEAKQKGGTNLQNLGYGALNSAINTGTEAMFGGLGKTFGVGALDDVVAKGITKRIGNKTIQKLAEVGIKASGEGIEEVIAGALDPIAKKLTYMPKEDLDKLYANTNLLEDFIVGSLVSGIAQTPSTISDIKQQNTNVLQQQPFTSPITAQTSQISDVTPQTGINTPIQTNVRETAQKDIKTTFDKIMKDRPGLNIQFNENIAENGRYIKRADGTRQILVNPNSPKAVEFVLVHELSHDLSNTPEYNKLKETILSYDKGIKGFEEARANLESIYRDVYTQQVMKDNPNITPVELQTRVSQMIDEEATNDVLGTMLSDQNYINKLRTEQPNTFQKILRWINDMLKRVSGKESKFLQDVKLKFENAYRQQGVAKEGTKLSINDKLQPATYVNETPIKVYRGEGKGIGNYTWVKGKFFADSKEFASRFGKVSESVIPKGQKIFDFDYIKENPKNRNIIPEKTLVDVDKLTEYLSKQGYTYTKNTNASGVEYVKLPTEREIIEREIKNLEEIRGRQEIRPFDDVMSQEERNRLDELYDKLSQLSGIESVEFSKTKQGKWQERLKETYEPLGIKNKKQTVIQPTTETPKQVEKQEPKIAKLLNEVPEIKVDKSIPKELDKVVQQIINKGHFVDKLAKETGNKELTFKYDKTLSADAEGQYVVGVAQTDNNGKKIGKSVVEIWKPVEDANLTEAFSDYLLHKHNIDRMSLKDRANVDLAIFEEQHPNLMFKERKSGSKKLKEFYGDINRPYSEIQELAKIGRQNGTTGDIETDSILDDAVEYVRLKEKYESSDNKPVFGEEITAEMSRQAVKDYEAKYKQFINWSKDIQTFNKNQLRNMTEAGLTSVETEKLLNDMYGNYVRIQREQTGTSPTTIANGRIVIKSPIQKAKGGTGDILPLKETMAQQVVQVKRAIRRNDLGQELLKELGGIPKGTPVDPNRLVDKTDEGYTMTVFQNGEPMIIDINEGLYESLKPKDRYSWEDNLLTKGLQKGARFQRSVLTVDNPFFVVTNFFKDLQDGMFNSKYSAKFLPNYVEAIKQIKNNSELWNLYLANGGNQNTYFDYDMKLTKEPKGVMKWVDKVRSVNEIVEQAPRFAEFLSTIQDGKSITEAMYNAAEVTTNFKRGGDITKALNRNGANFLNASIQGFEKQYRNLKGANGVKGYVSLLTKATLMGVVPSVLNDLLFGDDKDYEDLPADTKDRFYLFKIGDNKFVKIPKGRVLSIFGSAARRTLEAGKGNKEAYDGLWTTFINQLSPNNPLEDNVLAPILQAKANKAWYGGDIVPQRLQKFSPKNQYDETTDNFSKFIAKSLGDVGINVSAKKVNYVIDQYSGGLGDILLPLGTPRAETNPLAAKFTVNSIITNKNSAQFYETKDRLTQKVNDGNASTRQIIGLKYLNSVQSQLNDLYKSKRDIELSDKKDAIKRKEVEKLQNEINGIMRKSLQQYNKAERDGSYMRVGDMYFEQYRDTKTGEWKWRKSS